MGNEWSYFCTNLNFYDNINLEWKERIINMKIDRFNVVELKDGNRATIIDVRGKKWVFCRSSKCLWTNSCKKKYNRWRNKIIF